MFLTWHYRILILSRISYGVLDNVSVLKSYFGIWSSCFELLKFYFNVENISGYLVWKREALFTNRADGGCAFCSHLKTKKSEMWSRARVSIECWSRNYVKVFPKITGNLTLDQVHLSVYHKWVQFYPFNRLFRKHEPDEFFGGGQYSFSFTDKTSSLVTLILTYSK